MNKGPTELTVYILLALLSEPLKGYDISKRVKIISDGEIDLMNKSPYAKLRKMQELDQIEIFEKLNDVKIYRITDIGRKIIVDELKNIEKLKMRINREMEEHRNEK